MNQQNPNLPQKDILRQVKQGFGIPKDKQSSTPRIPRTITNIGKTKGRKPQDWGY